MSLRNISKNITAICLCFLFALCCSLFLYGCIKAYGQNSSRKTYYYALTKKIDLDQAYTNTSGGQFITFEDNLCYDSNKNGTSVGNGTLHYSRTVDGVEIYQGRSYFGNNTQYKFAKSRTVLNIVVGDGRIYVYKRCQAPSGVLTCSLIKKSSGSSTYTPTTPGGNNGGYASGYPSQNNNGGSSSSSSSSSGSSSKKQWKTVYYEEMCQFCHGSGKCETCNGNGWYYSPFGGEHIPCPNCEHNHNGVCAHCHGKGTITKSKQVYE